MKNYLFSAIMLVASVVAFSSCSNDDNEAIASPDTKGKPASIELSTKPSTRTVYTDDGTDLKAKFEPGKDYITIFFRKGTSNIGGGTYKLTCASVNEQEGSAVFTSSGDETLTEDVLRKVMAGESGLTDIHMILASEGSKPDFYKSFANDLSVQDGTLADATAHMQRVTNHVMTNPDNYEWDAEKGSLKLKNVDFDSNPELCTSIIRVNATFPAEAEVVPGDTPINLYANGAYSKYTCSWGNAEGATATDGTTPFTQARVASVVVNADGTKTATSYVCFWPTTKSPLTTVTVKSPMGNAEYSAEYTVKHPAGDDAAQFRGATVYNLSVNFGSTETAEKWVSDDASTIEVPNGTFISSTVDWLTYSGNTINVAANITGAPRTGVITVSSNGTRVDYNITQVSPKDFRGTYSFTTKVFAGTGAKTRAADPYTFNSVTFGAPRTTGELTDADGTKRTNNIGIVGLYGSTVLDACVEIDYDNQNVRFGVFLDGRDGQGQKDGDKYVAYLPELVTRTAQAWSSPWCFSETELGDPDYTWMWFTVSSDFKTITYTNRVNNNVEFSTVPQYSSKTMNQIAGICVLLSSTDVFNHTTVPNDNKYCQVFQVNAKGMVGNIFTKIANAAPTTVSGDNIGTGGYTEK